MRTRVFQDWVNAQFSTEPTYGTSVASVTQLQELWLDVSSFAGATFWIDISQVSGPDLDFPITLTLQTSPTLDEAYFQPCVPIISVMPSPTPLVVQTLRVPGTVPLARYLRWQVAGGSTDFSGTWSVTFRIRAAFSPEAFFVPMDVGGCVLWLRADQGITLATAGSPPVSAWADQSSSGLSLAQGTSGDQPLLSPTLGPNGTPMLSFNGTSQSLAASSCPLAASPWTILTVTNGRGTQVSFGSPTNGMAPVTWTNREIFYPGVLVMLDGTPQAGTWEAWAFTNTGSLTSFYVNGAPTTLANDTFQPLAPSAQMSVGAPGVFVYFTGSIAEIIAFNRALNAVELARVNTYLITRYSL